MTCTDDVREGSIAEVTGFEHCDERLENLYFQRCLNHAECVGLGRLTYAKSVVEEAIQEVSTIRKKLRGRND